MFGDKIIDVLEREIDEEILGKMPIWFKLLYKNYKKRKINFPV